MDNNDTRRWGADRWLSQHDRRAERHHKHEHASRGYDYIGSKNTDVSDSEARTRAKQAERDRIEQALNDTSGISEVSVGVYGENKAEIVSTGPDSYTVRVTMSYSYEYSCSGRSGAIDGLTTSVTYRVSAESVELLSVEEPIDNLCGR